VSDVGKGKASVVSHQGSRGSTNCRQKKNRSTEGGGENHTLKRHLEETARKKEIEWGFV